MGEVLQIIEADTERDRRTCLSLDLRVTGANRELAQWLIDHPRYSGAVVAGWLGCHHSRITCLRRWAQRGFEGKPFTPGRAAQRGAPLESLDNSEPDAELPQIESEVADPATIEDNALHAIARINEHARIFRRFFKVSPLDREAKERINTAIERMIQKWRLAQSTLARKEP